MPEQRPAFKPPTIYGGTTLESGVPNTGQISVTFGSTHQFSKLSGVVGPDVAIWVGGGRLEQGQIVPNAELVGSGQPIIFYDSAVVVSGGPISASGHKVVGVLREGFGLDADTSPGGSCRFDMAFTSGLMVSTASGQPGFTCSFTPVVSG